MDDDDDDHGTGGRMLRQRSRLMTTTHHRKNGERMSRGDAREALDGRLQDLRECVVAALFNNGMKNATVRDVRATAKATGPAGWTMTRRLYSMTHWRIFRIVATIFIVWWWLPALPTTTTAAAAAAGATYSGWWTRVCGAGLWALLIACCCCWPSASKRMLSSLVNRLSPTSVATPLHNLLAIPSVVTSATAWLLSKLVGGLYLTIRFDLEIERRRQLQRLRGRFGSVLEKEQDQLWKIAGALGEGWSAYGPHGDEVDGGLEWQHAVPTTGNAGASVSSGRSLPRSRLGRCSILHWMLMAAVAMSLLFAVGLYEHWSGYAQPTVGLNQVWEAALQDLSGATV